MWFDHKKIWISLSKNMTMTERQSHRKNPVFMNPSKQFYNPYDRGFCMNAVEFFIPCPLCCFCPNGDDSVFAETLKKEFPDGIKNSILSKPRSLYNIEDLQDQSYEQLARDSTVGTSRRDQENPDERKIGDSDQPSDLRYNIDAIITNSICQKFEKDKLYNWYTARIYSVVDIIGHPMHGAAKAVLSRHLENLQKIEADLQPQLSSSDEDTDGSGIYEEEGEESESEEEELNEQLDDIRKSRIKAIPKPESGSDSGAQKVGGPFMTKMQVLAQYRTIKKSKLLEFKSIEKEIPEHQREEFDRRREQFFINLEAQRDHMIEMTSQQKSSKISNLAEQEAKASDDEEEEEEEVEEEEESEEEKDEEIEHKKHKQNQFLTKITEMSKDDSQDGHNSSDAEDYKHHFEESPVKEESVEEEEPPMNVDENTEPVNEVPDFISEEAEGEKDDLEKGEGEKDDPEKEEGEEEPKEEQQPHN